MKSFQSVFILMAAFLGSAGFSNDPLADEINRSKKNGHYLFEGVWKGSDETVTQVRGLGQIVIKPSSASTGETSAHVALEGEFFGNREAHTTPDFLNIDTLQTRHLRISWDEIKEKSYRYTGPPLGARIRDFTQTLTKKCHAMKVDLAINPDSPDRMLVTIHYYEGTIDVNWPRTKLVYDGYFTFDGEPECTYNGQIVPTYWHRQFWMNKS